MRVVIRDATEADIPALARLHVAAWNQTYPGFRSPPTVALRESQWRDSFAVNDGTWFALVVERDGELVGFVKGKHYRHSELRQFGGELNKIYVLREYHGRGLGRRLMGHVARRFLSQSITSMVLFSEPSNPNGRFFEAMDGQKIIDKDGEFRGAYGWTNLKALAAMCAIDQV